MPYDPMLYSGAAQHYLAGRPPYSADLPAVLAAECGLDGTGRLLDAGCGPGVVIGQLAGLVGSAVGLDPDAEMLAEAARQVTAANVGWVLSTAEELPVLGLGPLRLVTFGQSFHWTDMDRMLDIVWAALEPGGSLALIHHDPERSAAPEAPQGIPVIPHRAVHELVRRRLGPGSLTPPVFRGNQHVTFQDRLSRSAFGGSRTLVLPGRTDLIRTGRQVLRMFLSLSICAPHLFGDRLEEFCAEVLDLLGGPDALFWDWPGDTVVVIATRQPSEPAR